MQATATANAQAWAAAEASLTARQNEFESAAAAAGEREKRAWEKLQAANTRMAAATAALDTLRAELAEANAGRLTSNPSLCVTAIAAASHCHGYLWPANLSLSSSQSDTIFPF